MSVFNITLSKPTLEGIIMVEQNGTSAIAMEMLI